MVFARLARNSARQAEALEVVLRHAWDYMRRLLSLGKAEEPQLPPPLVLRNILVDLGPVYVKLGQLLSTRLDLLPREYIEPSAACRAMCPPCPGTRWRSCCASRWSGSSAALTRKRWQRDPSPKSIAPAS
ncbi:hypothetical protein [Synechococcus sp. O70.2]|uniref:hypothetical protein n=1 Tax=Synechococcus sp. O70.2 TaxID=2964533 RepID=UPI0039C45CC0